jgi:hypothetical protein
MVSLRTVHVARRPKPSLKEILTFIHSLLEAKDKYPKSCILNCDETNWPVIFAKRKIWMIKDNGKSENQSVKGFVNGDPKASFTAMGTISLNGDAFPLFMLARGKTERCEKQINKIAQNKVSHSQNGWVTVQVMVEFLHFLREVVEAKYNIRQSQRILLVLDVYTSHRQDDLKRLAAAQRIDLLFIPPGMTAELQPLDAKLFGQLKSAGSKRWIQEYLYDPSTKFSKATASIGLQECWAKLNKEDVIACWEAVFANAEKILETETQIGAVYEVTTTDKTSTDDDFEP